MKPSGALRILFEEATSEDTKFSDKQKQLAYHTLKDCIDLNEIVKKFFKGEVLNDGEKEILQVWLKSK